MRAKLAQYRQHRMVNGIEKSNSCLACSYIMEGKNIDEKIYKGKKLKWNIGRALSCDSKNVIYVFFLSLLFCKEQYIGMKQDVRERMYQHVGYVRNKTLTSSTREYFNLPGHVIINMKFSILEQVSSNNPLYAMKRDKILIRKFNSFHAGIN